MLKNNLNFFQKKFHSLYNLLNNGKISLKTEETKISPFITVKINNKYIYSKYNPIKESEKLISNLKYSNQSVIIFLGYGIGYNLLPLKDIENKDIWIYEKNIELFYLSLNFIDYKKISKKNRLFFNIGKVYCLPDFKNINDIFIVEHKILTEIYKDFYIQIKNYIKNSLKLKIADITTTGYFSSIWFRNSINNLLFFNNSYSLINLKNKFKNISGIIISGGPSLDKYIKKFHNIKDKAVILSTGTASKRLIKEGIIPHFIISTDGGFYNYWHTKNLTLKKTILITDFSTNYLVNKFYNGRKSFINFNLGFIDFIIDVNKFVPEINMDGTVSASAVNFLRFLGVKNIYLLGQDFGYPFYLSHCKNSIYTYYGLNISTKLKTIDTIDFKNIMSDKTEYDVDYNNNKILTDFKLKLYKNWFNENSNNLYQLSLYSSKINSIPVSYKIELTNKNVWDIINDNIYMINYKIEKDVLKNKIKKYLNELKNNNINDFLKNIESTLLKGLNNFLEFDFFKYKNDLNKLEKIAKEKIKKYLHFIYKKIETI